MTNTINTFPSRPFDGQEFLDRYRILWRWNEEEQCWRRAGSPPDIPKASSTQTGLLSKQQKITLDSIPTQGGHFGIIVKPLLKALPPVQETLFSGTVEAITPLSAGTSIKVIESIISDVSSGTYIEWAGNILRFTKGALKNKGFVIYEVDGQYIKVLGDAEAATPNDTFNIFTSDNADTMGLIKGDIQLVSDSLDINCVMGDGDPILIECEDPITFPDTLDNPPGFNFQLGEKFLNTFCIHVPGCTGPRGEKGAIGANGRDGTGDGPRGEKGDSGRDALETYRFSGIKIQESESIYDTAVVDLELESAAGKLTVVKSKVKTPIQGDTADQFVTSTIHRGVVWTYGSLPECVGSDFEEDDFDNAFKYILSSPPDDPIGSDDVSMGYYPQGVEIGEDPKELYINKTNLSTFINLITDYYKNQLIEIEDKWNAQAKEYMTQKDKESRDILASLAMQLAECEWELPIEFCVGIVPDDCHPGPTGAAREDELSRMPTAGILLGDPFCEDSLAEWLGDYKVPAGAGESLPAVKVQYPSNTAMGSETLLEGGYVIQYLRGTYYDSNNPQDGYFVGRSEPGVGLIAHYDVLGPGPAESEQMPVSTAPHNIMDKTSVEEAYQNGSLYEKVITLVFTGTGEIELRAPLGEHSEGIGEVTVRVLRVLQCTGTGYGDLNDMDVGDLGHRDVDEGTAIEAE